MLVSQWEHACWLTVSLIYLYLRILYKPTTYIGCRTQVRVQWYDSGHPHYLEDHVSRHAFVLNLLLHLSQLGSVSWHAFVPNLLLHLSQLDCLLTFIVVSMALSPIVSYRHLVTVPYMAILPIVSLPPIPLRNISSWMSSWATRLGILHASKGPLSLKLIMKSSSC